MACSMPLHAEARRTSQSLLEPWPKGEKAHHPCEPDPSEFHRHPTSHTTTFIRRIGVVIETSHRGTPSGGAQCETWVSGGRSARR